jgi:hypothetical protein
VEALTKQNGVQYLPYLSFYKKKPETHIFFFGLGILEARFRKSQTPRRWRHGEFATKSSQQPAKFAIRRPKSETLHFLNLVFVLFKLKELVRKTSRRYDKYNFLYCFNMYIN